MEINTKEMNFDDMANNDILFQIKRLEADHAALKLQILSLYDELIEMENQFNKANETLVNRLKKA